MSEEDEEDMAKNGDLLGSDGRRMLHITTSRPICSDQSKDFNYGENRVVYREFRVVYREIWYNPSRKSCVTYRGNWVYIIYIGTF